MDRPEWIYNVDKYGIPLDHRSPLVRTKRGQHKVRNCISLATCQELSQFFQDALPLDPVDIIDSNSECDSTKFQSSLPCMT